MKSDGRLVDVGGTRLYVEQRGPDGGLPVFVLHGGPGLDHHEFADYLDPLADAYRLLLIDQRAQGRSDRDSDPYTWTLETMADDVSRLSAMLGIGEYAVLGHSYGAFVALQHACDAPGAALGTIVSNGLPSMRFLEGLDQRLAEFEPADLREQVTASWAREADARTVADFAAIMHDQLPWHFADPRDPRIPEYEERSAGTIYAPDVLRAFSGDFGGIDLEDRLWHVTQPVLVLAGRYDRTCPPEAAEVIAAGVADGRCLIFEESGHMTFVEEPARYVEEVRAFLDHLPR
ncbi:MAG: alpha/beta fold hydrolase [Actinomycetota bacterium]|nr:alpha/beta fold hydrolase [Actinomycetota bacterium]